MDQVLGPVTGQKTGISGTASALTTDTTPCRYVWLGAPKSATMVGSNTDAILIGNADGQVIPITTSNFEGLFIPTNSAAKLYVKSANSSSSQKLDYAIFY